MKLWATSITATCPLDGRLKKFGGPNIKAPTKKLAHEYAQNNGLGYCRIEGELIAEIPCKEGSYKPDWGNMIDYESTKLN